MMPDGIKGSQYFEIDHYKPQKRFPESKNEYNNLFYSCRNCNNSKKNFWPAVEQLEKGFFILNPCNYIMTDHVRYNGVRVYSRTDTGDFYIDAMRLNEESIVQHRQWILDNIKAYKKELQELNYIKAECEKQLHSNKRFKGKLQKILKETEANIQKFQKYIDEHTGNV